MSNKIKLEIEKTEETYIVADRDNNTISYYSDDDGGRKALIQYLVDNLLNKEITGGRKYRS